MQGAGDIAAIERVVTAFAQDDDVAADQAGGAEVEGVVGPFTDQPHRAGGGAGIDDFDA
jgi:hypothetical protein